MRRFLSVMVGAAMLMAAPLPAPVAASTYTISGTVAAIDGTTALVGVAVRACSPTPPNPCFDATTGTDGAYTIFADPGTYQVGFNGADVVPGYASGFYVFGQPGNFTLDVSAQWGHDVDVTAGNATLSPVFLPLGRSISGVVTDTDTSPLPNIRVYACEQHAGQLHPDCSTPQYGPGSAGTGPDGSFSIWVADDASYVIEFSDPAQPPAYASGFYSESTTPPGYVPSLSGASLVTVSGFDIGLITVELPAASAPGATPSGSNVSVTPAYTGNPPAAATVTFAQVSSPGITTVNGGSGGPTPPTGFALGSPPTYYDVSTTAPFGGPVSVCFDYSATSYTDPTQLRLYHDASGTWVDVTTSLNTATQTICGQATSLSPFAILQDVRHVTSLTATCVPNPGLPGGPVGCIAAVKDAGPGNGRPVTGNVSWSVVAGSGSFGATGCVPVLGQLVCATVFTPALTQTNPQSILVAYPGDVSHRASSAVVGLALLVARPDHYATPRGTKLAVSAPGVLANDTPSTGLVAMLIAKPRHGTLTLATNGSFSYAPAKGFVGDDWFTYSARAGSVSSAPTMVTISVQ